MWLKRRVIRGLPYGSYLAQHYGIAIQRGTAASVYETLSPDSDLDQLSYP